MPVRHCAPQIYFPCAELAAVAKASTKDAYLARECEYMHAKTPRTALQTVVEDVTGKGDRCIITIDTCFWDDIKRTKVCFDSMHTTVSAGR